MATFRAGGHEWQLRLTIGLVGRLRTEAGFELGKLLDAGQVAEAVMGDPFKLGEVLWIMCRAEAEGRGLTTPDEFFELLGPEELQAAVLGVLAAVVDEADGRACLLDAVDRQARLRALLPQSIASLSGEFRVDGLMGFDQGQIKLEALVPAPVRVLAVVRAAHWRQ